MRTIKTYFKGAPFYNAFLRQWDPLASDKSSYLHSDHAIAVNVSLDCAPLAELTKVSIAVGNREFANGQDGLNSRHDHARVISGFPNGELEFADCHFLQLIPLLQGRKVWF
jgi:hypothetical protein